MAVSGCTTGTSGTQARAAARRIASRAGTPTRTSGHAARDFKLIVGAALFSLIVEEGGRLPSLDIIVVETRHDVEDKGFCVLVYASRLLLRHPR